MKSLCWVGLVVAATLTGGCTNDYWPIIDPKPKTGNVSTETSAPKTVDLSVGKAWYWNNEVTVMGSAQRNALSGKKNITGFIDVEILDKDNNVLQTVMASLIPNKISSDDPSQYKISIWTQHPAMDHLKIVFVDQRDEAAYLGGGSDMSGAGGASSQSGNYTRPSASGNSGFSGFGRGINGISGTGGVSGVSGIATGGAR